MATVFDVAAYILQHQGTITTMKLQKLVYYSQAWSLVWDESPLFNEKIEAWASGPVVRELYNVHKGWYLISSHDFHYGDTDKLTVGQKETIDAVLTAYGSKPAQWLSDLTHMEDPWNIARQGITPGENSENEITQAMMLEYYSSLPPESYIT
jgi:uncharacterized phage-associated protein